MKKKMFVKRIVSLVLCMSVLFGTMGSNVFAAENNEKAASATQYKVYNGYGEIVYTADSLEEAEAYISGTNEGTSTRSARSAWLAAKTLIKIGAKLALSGAVLYEVNGVMTGESTIIDVIDLFFPASSLAEMATNRDVIYVYSSSGLVVNPYPPNSYQGSQWYRTNFYCVVAE